MDQLIHVIGILLLLLFAYLAFSTGYFFLFAFGSLFQVRLPPERSSERRKFAVLIPAYMEDAVIVDVAREAAGQDYPEEFFDVVVIADSFREETLKQLRNLKITLIEVNFERSTKTKALNQAMSQLEDDHYDIGLILDADNLMESDCLHKINDLFNRGCRAVQCHRVAKNLNTSFAVLDAISEEISNSFFRKGQRFWGLSSGLVGSGMAFSYKFFKRKMMEINAVGGFDKDLELILLSERITIAYRGDALVFDEKIQKPDAFYNQRRRWISTQVHYLRISFRSAFIKLFREGNLDYFNKVMQWTLPPRVIYLGGMTLITAAVLLFHPSEFWRTAWSVLWLLGVGAFILAIPRKFYNLRTLKAMLSLPRAFLLMILALLRLRGSNKQFIHTEHTAAGSDEAKKMYRPKK